MRNGGVWRQRGGEGERNVGIRDGEKRREAKEERGVEERAVRERDRERQRR